MLLPRELIYRERTLEEFRIDDPTNLFRHLYINLKSVKGLRPRDISAYETITSTLNTICYICTDAQLQPEPSLALGDYIRYIQTVNPMQIDKNLCYVTVVLHYVQTVFYHYDNGFVELCKVIEGWLDDNGWARFLRKSRDYFFENSGNVDRKYITPRPISDRFLGTKNWRAITNDYDIDGVKFIIHNISKLTETRYMVLKSIRDELNENLSDYNFHLLPTDVSPQVYLELMMLELEESIRKYKQRTQTVSESSDNSVLKENERLTEEVSKLKRDNERLTEEVSKLRDDNSRLPKGQNTRKKDDEQYYFCDFVRRYMNSNKNKTVETRKEVRKSINDIMTHLKMLIPRELQAALNQFDDEKPPKEVLDAIGKNTEALMKLASRPAVGTIVMEQNNNGVSPHLANDQPELLNGQ